VVDAIPRCVVRDEEGLEAALAREVGPLVLVRAARLAVVRTSDDGPPGPPDLARIAAHARVAWQVHQLRPALPMRLGGVPADDATLQRLLADHAEAWHRGLERVAGCDEFGLRWRLPPAEHLPAAGAATSGVAYLRARRAALEREAVELEQARARLAPLLTDLGSLHRAHVAELVATTDGRPELCVALLVPRDGEGPLRDHLAASTEAITCTGPWAPFSFVPDCLAGNV